MAVHAGNDMTSTCMYLLTRLVYTLPAADYDVLSMRSFLQRYLRVHH